jgi:hypothetical protein
MSQIYDSAVEAVRNDQVKYRDCFGRVQSMRRGEADKDGFNKNNFDLKRITVSARGTVYLKLEPHDDASQYVRVDIPLHQARWLFAAILEAIDAAEQWHVRRAAENARARQRRQAKKDAAKEPLL